MRSCALQYSVSVRTDQVVKGRPSSAGLESAVSTSSRSWRAVMIGIRPRGLFGRSKVRKPLSLKRRTQREVLFTFSPARLALSAKLCPARTRAITRYRRCSRAGSETWRSLLRSLACSVRVRGRRRLVARAAIAFLQPSPGSPSRRSVLAPHDAIKLERH